MTRPSSRIRSTSAAATSTEDDGAADSASGGQRPAATQAQQRERQGEERRARRSAMPSAADPRRGGPGGGVEVARGAHADGEHDEQQARGHGDVGAGGPQREGATIAIASHAAAAAWQATAPMDAVTERRSAAVDTVHRAPAAPSITAA